MNLEYSLINAIITQSHIIPALKYIDVSYFKINETKSIYKFLLEYYTQYKKVPTISVITSEFPDYKFQEEFNNVDFFVRELIERKYENELTSIFSESIKLLKERKPSEIINYISSRILDLRISIKVDEDKDITKESDSRLERYVSLKKTEDITGIPCGLKTIDELTMGFQNGELISIMGLPGIGKSWLSLFFAKNAWLNGYKILLISLEMSFHQIANRFDSLMTGMKHAYIKHGKLSSEEFENYKKYLNSLKEGKPNFIISNPSKCNQSTILAKIMEHRPDLCIIDYVSLIIDERGGKEWTAIDNIMKDLKLFAKDKNVNIPIIVLCQVNRGFERSSSELPELSDIAHSFSIAAHSDIVMALHQNDEMRRAKRMKFGILKNRDERNIEIELFWDLSASQISEFSESTFSESSQGRASKIVESSLEYEHNNVI